MSDIALYFPRINLPDDAWVKAAALHWTRLGRIVPHRYPIHDSDVVKQLQDELNFVIDVDPGRGRFGSGLSEGEVARLRSGYGNQPETIKEGIELLFYQFLAEHRDQLIPRYGTAALGIEPLDASTVFDERQPLDPRLETVHPSKMTWRLATRLRDEGLLARHAYRWRRGSDGRVLHESELAMHRDLAGLYMAMLAGMTAGRNGMTPITDDASLCGLTSGWTVESMAQIFLGTPASPADSDPVISDPQKSSQIFASLAMQTVVPKDLANVPVARIIEARKRLLPELMRYREFLDSLIPDFVEISKVPDPEVRSAKLRNHVDKHITQPVAAMEREIGRLGLQPVRALISLQTLAPPAAVGVVANAMHLPTTVIDAGVVAGCLVGAANNTIVQRRQGIAAHPAGYLLSLRRELAPGDAVAQVRSAIRRVTSRPHGGSAKAEL